MTATILTDVIFTLPLVSCSHAAHTLRTTAPAPIKNRPRTDHWKHGPHTVTKEIKQLFWAAVCRNHNNKKKKCSSQTHTHTWCRSTRALVHAIFRARLRGCETSMNHTHTDNYNDATGDDDTVYNVPRIYALTILVLIFFIDWKSIKNTHTYTQT